MVEVVEGERQHVLIIEDDASTLEVYAALLADEGYGVTLAPAPSLAPAAVAALAPDLILLDLHFRHDIDGLEFLEQLKADHQTCPIAVVICSADHHRLQQSRDQLVAWTCGVLAKPFDLEDLLAEIRACTAPHDAAAPSADCRDSNGA